MIGEALVVLALAGDPADSILCPPYLGDPPWRRYTCYIIARMGTQPDRPLIEASPAIEAVRERVEH